MLLLGFTNISSALIDTKINCNFLELTDNMGAQSREARITNLLLPLRKTPLRKAGMTLSNRFSGVSIDAAANFSSSTAAPAGPTC